MALTMGFQSYQTDLKEASLLDYYTTLFHWGMEKKYDNRQLGGLITLGSKLISNLEEKLFTRPDNIKFLNECFSGIGSENPDNVSIQLYFFTLQDAKDIVQYIFSTFFHHYRLYRFLFTGEQDELIIGSDLSVNVCPETIGPFPQPLEEAIPKEILDMMAKAKEDAEVPEVDDNEDLLQTEELAEAVLTVVKESDKASLKNVTKEDVKKVLDKIRSEMIIPANTELKDKIKEKELDYVSKINKLQIK